MSANTKRLLTDPALWPDVCEQALPLVNDLIERSHTYGVVTTKGPLGCRIIDCGIDCLGGVEAGVRVAEICMGGLGRVRPLPLYGASRWPMGVSVTTSHAVLACLGSQYAGWNLSSGNYYALGSGPGRAMAAVEGLFKELGYRCERGHIVLVLEVDSLPPDDVVEKIAQACGVRGKMVTLLLTPTVSLAGMTQIAARVLEVALHKAHVLGFPLQRILDGTGWAPLPPPAPDFITAMGRSNDAIIYGGAAHLFVSGPDAEARRMAEQLPSRNAKEYGQPFAQIFKAFKGDFYAIDPSLFSPARVIVTSVESGVSFHAGSLDEKILDNSFSGKG